MENNETINHWKNGLRIRHIAHSRAFSRFKLWDRMIGSVSTLLSAVVATTVFASFADSDSNRLIIIAGGISILATLFAASYSFLKLGELAERHHQAAASFGQLRRSLEVILMDKDIVSVDHEKLLEINAVWSELEKKVPDIPQRIYNRARKRIYKNNKRK